MGAWDTYEKRINASGKTQRYVVFNREAYFLNKKLGDSLSYHEAIVDGEKRQVVIINSDNLDEKIMMSMPGEDFECGKYVEWMRNHWLIKEKDANNELYTRVKLWQCNYLLHWIDNNGVLHEQWCVIEDGTKLANSFRVAKAA